MGLKAGVLEDGEFKASERGTGQASVISPLPPSTCTHIDDADFFVLIPTRSDTHRV
jgi:hypothetical protein